MLSYIASFIWSENEIQADQKVLRQKYLVLQQIKDHRIRLKSINTKKIYMKRPSWVTNNKKKDMLP